MRFGDVFKNKIDAGLVIPVLVGLLYVATGGWSSERWNTAFALMGLGPAARMGYERGFNTYNPALRSKQPRRNGRFVKASEVKGEE